MSQRNTVPSEARHSPSADGEAAAASGPAPEAEAPGLPPITVTSTRTERRADDVPNTVTVKSAAEVEASGARDLKDLLRNELDVTVRAAAPRFTAAGASTRRALRRC